MEAAAGLTPIVRLAHVSSSSHEPDVDPTTTSKVHYYYRLEKNHQPSVVFSK